jgi:hypothetical protein
MLRTIALTWGCLCCLTMARAEETKVPLKTEIPEEILAGTPPETLALLFPHLEKLVEGEPPDFLVPKGTVNLARGKKVTASSDEPLLGELAFITDGKKQGTERNYVELDPDSQWVQIDLEKPAAIYAVYIWHYFREARSYNDVIIQISDDASFKQGVQTIYNNDQDNSSGQGIGKSRAYIDTFRGRLFDAKGVKGRYVRIYSNGNTANDYNHYVEVEVFGQPAS